MPTIRNSRAIRAHRDFARAVADAALVPPRLVTNAPGLVGGQARLWVVPGLSTGQRVDLYQHIRHYQWSCPALNAADYGRLERRLLHRYAELQRLEKELGSIAKAYVAVMSPRLSANTLKTLRRDAEKLAARQHRRTDPLPEQARDALLARSGKVQIRLLDEIACLRQERRSMKTRLSRRTAR
jgi:hypothetical protein